MIHKLKLGGKPKRKPKKNSCRKTSKSSCCSNSSCNTDSSSVFDDILNTNKQPNQPQCNVTKSSQKYADYKPQLNALHEALSYLEKEFGQILKVSIKLSKNPNENTHIHIYRAGNRRSINNITKEFIESELRRYIPNLTITWEYNQPCPWNTSCNNQERLRISSADDLLNLDNINTNNSINDSLDFIDDDDLFDLMDDDLLDAILKNYLF